MTLWRMSNHAGLSGLSGEGGRRASARWHTAGNPVVYLASSPAAALLESFVHELALDELPEGYQWLEVLVDDLVSPASSPVLPDGWHQELSKSRAIGDAWLNEGAAALLEVPSVIVPRTTNYLFNPRHPQAARVRITGVIHYPLDPRLARRS